MSDSKAMLTILVLIIALGSVLLFKPQKTEAPSETSTSTVETTVNATTTDSINNIKG